MGRVGRGRVKEVWWEGGTTFSRYDNDLEDDITTDGTVLSKTRTHNLSTPPEQESEML